MIIMMIVIVIIVIVVIVLGGHQGLCGRATGHSRTMITTTVI